MPSRLIARAMKHPRRSGCSAVAAESLCASDIHLMHRTPRIALKTDDHRSAAIERKVRSGPTVSHVVFGHGVSCLQLGQAGVDFETGPRHWMQGRFSMQEG